MNLLKTAFNFASEAAQSYYSSYQKQQKLREILNTCSYNDDTKFVIQKAVKQVYNVYPDFTIDVLEFVEKGQKKRFLQLKCIMDIQIRGQNHKVDFNMMIPAAFPKKPPFVRIINQSSEYMVSSFYKSLQSPTDHRSFILNEKLTQIRNWDESKSIVNIVMQAQSMMRQNFPFIRGSYKQNHNGHPDWGTQNSYNNYGGNNNYGFQNSHGSSYPSTQNKSKPPIPFSTTNVQQSIENGQRFMSQSKKMIQKLKNQHMRSVQKIQYMQVIKTSLESQQEYLRHENLKIANFLRKNQQSNIKDLSSLIRPQDERSEQMLDLVCSIRAREECLGLLQGKLNEGVIDFNGFIKYARRIEEEKFEDKFLLAKCIEKSR